MAVATLQPTESAAAGEQEILAAKIERLQALDLQLAQFGWLAPPHRRNEARALRREIDRARPALPQDDDARWSLLYGEMRDMRDEVRDVRAGQRQLYVMLPVLMVLISMFLAVVVSVGNQHATISPSTAPASAGSVAPATLTPGDTPLLGGRP
jgi:hypothetical protein